MHAYTYVLTVHAASLGVQLLPAMTTLVFGDNKSPVILLIGGEVLSSVISKTISQTQV